MLVYLLDIIGYWDILEIYYWTGMYLEKHMQYPEVNKQKDVERA